MNGKEKELFSLNKEKFASFLQIQFRRLKRKGKVKLLSFWDPLR